jgi:secretion/DNA translocation related CpaE-like protein
MRPARPLFVTGDPALLDELLRLCAAAGCEPDVAPDPATARRHWASASCVVVSSDLAAGCVRASLARRGGVVLVGADPDDSAGTDGAGGAGSGLWQRAVELGAEHVIFLPDAQAWLVDRLAEATEAPGRPGPVLGVMGGRGGAGATTLATALAVTAQRTGRRAVLVDADPLGGGLDLVLGLEGRSGLRWPELAASRGRVSAAALAAALPDRDGLAVLSHDRDEPVAVPAAAMSALLDAATRVADLVVVDLPRALDEAARTVLERARTALVVVPAELRACAAAGRVAALAAEHSGDLRGVVRLPAPGGLSPRQVAEAVGVPLAGVLRAEPGLPAALERGEAPGGRARGPLARLCTRLLPDLAPARGAAA